MKLAASGRLFVVVAVTILFPVPSFAGAQGASTTGRVIGTVTDGTGAVVPGVTVTAASQALMGVQTAVTGEQGQYRFPSLPPGAYQITFELAGFTTVERSDIRVSLGFTADVNVVLPLASVQETVTISGQSPVVDTQNTSVLTNITAETMKNIPNSRDFFGLIAEAPGMTVARFDVGGSTAGTQTAYTAFGTSGQNRVNIDGVNTTEGSGSSGMYVDYGMLEEVSLGISSAADASMPTPGVLVNAIMKSGGNQVHGDIYLDYENESLQGRNIDDELKNLGLGEGQRMMKYMDPNANIGGPIKKDKLWYFFSIRDQKFTTKTAGWPPEDPTKSPGFLTDNQQAAYKLTYQLSSNNKFSHHLEWARKLQPYRNAGPTYSRDAVNRQDDATWVGHVDWSRIVNPSFFFAARFSTFGYNWPLYAYGVNGEVGTNLRNRMSDSFTGDLAGGDYNRRLDRRRFQGEWTGNVFVDSFAGGEHAIKIGYTSELETGKYQYNGYKDQLRLIFRSTNSVSFTTPYRVELYNMPTTTHDEVWHHGAYLQDQIRFGARLTVNAGLRWDYYNAFEPEQVIQESPYRNFFYAGAPLMTSAGPYSLAATPYAANWKVPATQGLLVYNAAFAPRFGIAWNVQGDGKTVVKLSAGRFYNNPSVDITGGINPITNTNVTFGWIDRNADRLFQGDELGPFVSLTGGARNTVQKGIGHPYTNEFNVFLERQLIPDLGFRVGFVWKKQNNAWGIVDLGRPESLWSVPITVNDPGPDGVANTPDDGKPFTAYNLATVNGQLPVSQLQYQSPDWYDQTYKNIDVTFNKRMSNRWSLMAAFLYTWKNEIYPSATSTSAPLWNPNLAYNAFTHTTMYTAKVLGTYQGPWNLVLSPVWRYQAGAPLPRQLSVSTNAATFSMLVEPSGTYRQTNVSIFDLRLEKQVPFKGKRFGVFVDLFNIGNSNAFQTQLSTTSLRTVIVDGVSKQVQNFLYPTVVIPPRILRFGVKLAF